jgi:hypothetical protein
MGMYRGAVYVLNGPRLRRKRERAEQPLQQRRPSLTRQSTMRLFKNKGVYLARPLSMHSADCAAAGSLTYASSATASVLPSQPAEVGDGK